MVIDLLRKENLCLPLRIFNWGSPKPLLMRNSMGSYSLHDYPPIRRCSHRHALKNRFSSEERRSNIYLCFTFLLTLFLAAFSDKLLKLALSQYRNWLRKGWKYSALVMVITWSGFVRCEACSPSLERLSGCVMQFAKAGALRVSLPRLRTRNI